MHNFALLISYEGTDFLGFQKTKHGPSIEEALEKALSTIFRHPITLQAASRTDKGVHAEGQVVNFFSSLSEPSNLLLRLNSLLPKTIRVKNFQKMDFFENFHPTLSAIKKRYAYTLFFGKTLPPFLVNHTWHYPYHLDINLMEKEAKKLIGTHDFSAFTTPKFLKNPIRTLFSIEIKKFEKGLVLEFIGDHFLFRMVRILAGTLANIGSGKICLGIDEILQSKDRKKAGMTAPAYGLVLKEVVYPSTAKIFPLYSSPYQEKI